MAKKKALPPRVVKTIAAAAKRLGVAERVLAGWLAAGCPGKRSAYDVEAIAAWRAENRRPARNAAPEGQRARYAASREKAQAKREWLKLRKERGDVILVDRAAQVIKQHVAEVVTHLDQLPDFAVAGSRLPADQKKKLRERLRQKIADLRSTLERSLRAMAAAAKRDATKAEEED